MKLSFLTPVKPLPQKNCGGSFLPADKRVAGGAKVGSGRKTVAEKGRKSYNGKKCGKGMEAVKRISRLGRLAVVLALLASLAGCGGNAAVAAAPAATSASGGSYTIPPFSSSAFHPEQAVDYGSVKLDASALTGGVVAVSANSGSRLKFQVVLGETKYNYDLPNDGQAAVFPLNMGDGNYTFRLMEQVGESKYACIWSESREVVMADEFQPFLRPSQMVNYDAGSQCVSKARELAAGCGKDIDAASAIYDYLVENIRYDDDKAATVQPGYLPAPDETLQTGKGICFDYAALAAAMMRSLGIPCKLITGYVGNEIYHAWNSFYIHDQGWVTVEIKAPANQWKRVDITFAAGGLDAKKLDDDSRYTTRYTY